MSNSAVKIKSCFNKTLKASKRNVDSWSEEDLRQYFNKTGILDTLNYNYEDDVRFERFIKKGGKRTDLTCSDDYGNIVFVIEFKKPSEKKPLESFEDELLNKYVRPLKARYGLLYNGLEVIIFKRVGLNLDEIFHKESSKLTDKDCSNIGNWLCKPFYDMTKISKVVEYFQKFSEPSELRPVDTKLAKELFFEDFMLKERSLFSKLVHGMIELFDHQYGKSKFLTSAYDFWLKSYAKKPDKIPDSWKRLLKNFKLSTSKDDINKFMFCLETTYALFTRLTLAKACEDHDFPHISFKEFLSRLKGWRGDIALVSWGILLTEWIENLRSSLVESVFEEDIFYWWTDKFDEMRTWKTNDIFSGKLVANEFSHFGKSIADILFTLYKYDFSKIEGDPLGDLYQKYFDKETRKALGEFYTPKEVVKYILNSVNYKGRFIVDKRLLDPACGSGTFLVEALKEYINSSKDRADEIGWGEILKKLCNEFHIVGFDIHPFATIMAQIHFMLILIPYYKMAIESDKTFVLRRIPIFRTDSLIFEKKSEEGGQKDLLSFYEDVKDIKLNITLPIKQEIEDKEFIEIEIVMPRSGEVWDKTDLKNIPEYFCALQAIFDVVKYQARKNEYTVKKDLLSTRLKEYLTDKKWDRLIDFFIPYSNQILEAIKDLKYKFGDGRLVKSIEDVMLAGLLKNYVKYNYVVGNPPYVNVLKIPKESRDYYLEKYPTATGRVDLYILFLERGISWLKEEGYLGFINPTKFMVYTYGSILREYIIDNCKMQEIVDVANCESVFEQDITTGIFIFKKGAEKNYDIKVTLIKKDDKTILLDLIKENKTKEDTERYSRFLININDFVKTDDKIFSTQLSKKNSKIIDIIEKKGELLGTHFDIDQCIRIGSAETRKKLILNKDQIEKLAKNERDKCKRILDAEEIERYLINWNGRYLKYEPSLLYNPKKPEIFECEKLMFKNTSKYLTTAYDNGFIDDTSKDYYYALNTIYVIKLNELHHSIKEKFPGITKYLACYLNSNLAEFYYRVIFWALRIPGGSMKYREVIKYLPVIYPNKENTKILNEITKRFDLIYDQIRIKKAISEYPNSYLEEIKGIETDKLKYEFRSNHESLKPAIDELVNEEGFCIKLGKKEKDIFCESKEYAEYLFTFFINKKFKKNDKVEILVPGNKSKVSYILKRLKEDITKVKTVQISNIENEINTLIYNLYDIKNEKDIETIEKFLSEFCY